MKKKIILFSGIFIIILLGFFFFFFREDRSITPVTIDGFEFEVQHNISIYQGEHSFYLDELADLLPDLFIINHDDLVEANVTITKRTFSLILEADDEEYPMPEENIVLVKEDGVISFKDITFTEAGEFTYHIFIKDEENLEDEEYLSSNWTFDETIFSITVVITDDSEDNELSANILIEEELIFINDYRFNIAEELDIVVERIQEEARALEEELQRQIALNQMALNDVAITPMFIQGILLVNKHHPLPRSWNPGEDPRAGAQVRLLINEMRSLGLDICTSFSGFRSWDHQNTVFNNFVAQRGLREAERIAARPGHSEHQTGLAFDLRHTSGHLVTRAPEAEWLATNAHRFGFIVRYPANSEHITGYIHEPWHLRYIGARAEEIWRSGLTLEEFLGAGPAPTYRR